MNTVIETTELQDATKRAKHCQDTLLRLRKQRRQQQRIVDELSTELRHKVIDRKWMDTETAEDAAAARAECTELADLLQSEEEVLGAIDSALRNAQADIANAGGRVQKIITEIITAQYGGALVESTSNELTAT